MTYQFTPADYDKIVKAAKDRTAAWTDDPRRAHVQKLTLDLLTLDSNHDVIMEITQYISGVQTWGGSYDGPYGKELESVWKTTRRYYEVTDFSLFDKDGNDIPCDFDREIITNRLSYGRRPEGREWFGKTSA